LREGVRLYIYVELLCIIPVTLYVLYTININPTPTLLGVERSQIIVLQVLTSDASFVASTDHYHRLFIFFCKPSARINLFIDNILCL
jgi:hypothetical protein